MSIEKLHTAIRGGCNANSNFNSNTRIARPRAYHLKISIDQRSADFSLLRQKRSAQRSYSRGGERSSLIKSISAEEEGILGYSISWQRGQYD
jgi:hypothetical protein